MVRKSGNEAFADTSPPMTFLSKLARCLCIPFRLSPASRKTSRSRGVLHEFKEILPAEVRIKIWRFALLQSPCLVMEVNGDPRVQCLGLRSIGLHPLLSVCFESRQEILEFYPDLRRILQQRVPSSSLSQTLELNNYHDIVFSMDNTDGRWFLEMTTSSFRNHELKFGASTAKSLKHLVLSWDWYSLFFLGGQVLQQSPEFHMRSFGSSLRHDFPALQTLIWVVDIGNLGEPGKPKALGSLKSGGFLHEFKRKVPCAARLQRYAIPGRKTNTHYVLNPIKVYHFLKKVKDVSEVAGLRANRNPTNPDIEVRYFLKSRKCKIIHGKWNDFLLVS